MGIFHGHKRNFLFLQGMASRFFGELGVALQSRGHFVSRINFNGGDSVFWPLPGATDYTGSAEGWSPFLKKYLYEHQITDIILFGDCRPLHRLAIEVAKLNGVSVFVFEEGYLRPNWITMEKGGVNAHSSLGRDAEWFAAMARDLPPWKEGEIAANSMARRSIEDILYVIATQLWGWRFRAYRTHRPWSTWVEYAGGARRLFRKPKAKRRLSEMLDTMQRDGRDYYLFPLQLDADSQIRYHSHFKSVKPGIEFVIQSFSEAAPADATLLVTEHPLDTSPFDWGRIIFEIASAAGVEDRVHFFEGGSSERAILGCRGLITVNSTIGYLALKLGRPLIALGQAIYDIPELTFQDGLDRFWFECAPPNPTVFDDFRRVVAAHTQINGAFFSDSGLRLAVAGAIVRLEAQATATPMFKTAPADRRERTHFSSHLTPTSDL